ncbi:protease modulator HflC [Parachitinimonas caeni]|uniref:Protein HflC n=1 Tax=Parachitinimonas caeni TaxID=3031301 RepID=A0ABT7DTF5_9NEIS|nr:protease modulator HflC [Parachitinimonas caeni]MDK2123322.1 protease modulator HflC [Parachitinimonas caeni]
MNKLLTTALTLLLALMLVNASIFTVDQRQYAIVFQFREAVRVITKPGIQFKIPLLQDYRYFDRRIQTIDADEPARIQTIEKMNLKVDSYVKWQIVDVERYYKAVGTESRQAADRLRNTVNNVLRNEFARRTVQDVISGKRDEVMALAQTIADADARRIGVRVIDVRVRRVDFEDRTSQSVFDRMQSERKAVANQLRAEGAAEAEQIRAQADRTREVMLAEAYNHAQQVKGEGDAKASAIYAQAYGQNPEFYSLYKSLDAYKQSFKSRTDVMVLDPSSDFFKYLKTPGRSGGK